MFHIVTASSLFTSFLLLSIYCARHGVLITIPHFPSRLGLPSLVCWPPLARKKKEECLWPMVTRRFRLRCVQRRCVLLLQLLHLHLRHRIPEAHVAEALGFLCAAQQAAVSQDPRRMRLLLLPGCCCCWRRPRSPCQRFSSELQTPRRPFEPHRFQRTSPLLRLPPPLLRLSTRRDRCS